MRCEWCEEEFVPTAHPGHREGRKKHRFCSASCQTKSWSAARKATGTCICGRPLRPGRRTCATCRTAARRWEQEHRRKCKDAGICRHCGVPSNGRSACGDCYTKLSLSRHYGLTLERYHQMLRAQGGACAICGEVETGLGSTGSVRRRLSVDHVPGTDRRDPANHRGLLCSRCNAGLGMFNDRAGLLIRAAAYVARYVPADDAHHGGAAALLPPSARSRSGGAERFRGGKVRAGTPSDGDGP